MELVGRDPPPWEYLSSRALPGRERLGRHDREGAVTSDGGGAVNTGVQTILLPECRSHDHLLSHDEWHH